MYIYLNNNDNYRFFRVTFFCQSCQVMTSVDSLFHFSAILFEVSNDFNPTNSGLAAISLRYNIKEFGGRGV
jgi:hypothetical protein